MSEGSGPSHLISVLISVIILHTQINRNRHLLLLLRQLFFFVLMAQSPFFSSWNKWKVLFNLGQTEKSSFSLHGNIFISLEGFFFLTVLHYYKAETNFKRKLCFLVKKTNRFSYSEYVKICLLCHHQNHLLNFTSTGKKFWLIQSSTFFAARKVCALEFLPNLQIAAFICIFPEHLGNTFM